MDYVEYNHILMIPQLCESLLVAYNFLKARGPKDLSGADQVAANKIYAWASDAALPSPVYAQTEEPSDGESRSGLT